MDKLNLSGLSKCDENWSKMKKNEKGRVCSECDQTIYDFRNKSFQEIGEMHLYSEGRLCGLYSKEQLAPKAIAPKPSGNWSFTAYAMAATTFLSVGSFSAVAQDTKPSFSVSKVSPTQLKKIKEQKKQAEEKAAKQKKNTSRSLSGKVEMKRAEDQRIEALPYVNVVISGTNLGTVTDVEGNFRIDLSSLAEDTDSLEMVVSFIGYQKLIYRVAVGKNMVQNALFTKAQNDLTSFSVVVKEPWYKRFFRWFGGLFRPTLRANQ